MNLKSFMGIEKVAASMWNLISHGRTWEWCVVNDTCSAAEMRHRAKQALEDGGFLQGEEEDFLNADLNQMDLRLKAELVRIDLSEAQQ